MPDVAIACGLSEGGLRRGRPTHYLDGAYAQAIADAGGRPRLLPPVGDPALALAGAAALLVPGGDDLLPERAYPDAVRFVPVPEAQLAFDRGLLRAASAARLPVLGVCYGMQLLALEAGGRLHYDLPTDVPEADDHLLGHGGGRHAIAVTAHTRLATALGTGAVAVNSRHHQAVAEPG